jgi:hypothetical protein
MIIGLFDVLLCSLPAYPCDKLFQHATTGRKRAVAYVSDHVHVDNIGGEVAVGLDVKHAGENGTAGLQVAVAELGNHGRGEF